MTSFKTKWFVFFSSSLIFVFSVLSFFVSALNVEDSEDRGNVEGEKFFSFNNDKVHSVDSLISATVSSLTTVPYPSCELRIYSGDQLIRIQDAYRRLLINEEVRLFDSRSSTRTMLEVAPLLQLTLEEKSELEILAENLLLHRKRKYQDLLQNLFKKLEAVVKQFGPLNDAGVFFVPQNYWQEMYEGDSVAVKAKSTSYQKHYNKQLLKDFLSEDKNLKLQKLLSGVLLSRLAVIPAGGRAKIGVCARSGNVVCESTFVVSVRINEIRRSNVGGGTGDKVRLIIVDDNKVATREVEDFLYLSSLNPFLTSHSDEELKDFEGMLVCREKESLAELIPATTKNKSIMQQHAETGKVKVRVNRVIDIVEVPNSKYVMLKAILKLENGEAASSPIITVDSSEQLFPFVGHISIASFRGKFGPGSIDAWRTLSGDIDFKVVALFLENDVVCDLAKESNLESGEGEQFILQCDVDNVVDRKSLSLKNPNKSLLVAALPAAIGIPMSAIVFKYFNIWLLGPLTAAVLFLISKLPAAHILHRTFRDAAAKRKAVRAFYTKMMEKLILSVSNPTYAVITYNDPHYST